MKSFVMRNYNTLATDFHIMDRKASALLHFRTPLLRALLLLMTLMQKHSLTLYRSPNPNLSGYESAIAPKLL